MDDENPPSLKPSPLSRGAADALAGTRYRVVRILGQGAAGQVFEAEHVALGKRVVAKVLKVDVAEDAAMADRMRLEAQLLAVLANEHIPVAHDFGVTAAGRTYLVMDYFAGRTLSAELKERGALGIAESIGLMKELLEGLAVAHAAGVVHRDIKPDNIFLAEINGKRVLKILDFGIAKLLEEKANEIHPSPLAQATAAGMCVGTPRYLAPEQAIGSPKIDHRADLYSATLILYRMVAGRDAFAHLRDAYPLLRAQIAEVPKPPSAVALQSIPPSLDALVAKGLEKLPEARFTSAAELIAELDRILSPAPSTGWTTTERMDARGEKAAAPILTKGGTELIQVGPRGDDIGTRDTVLADPPPPRDTVPLDQAPTTLMDVRGPEQPARTLPFTAAAPLAKASSGARARWIVGIFLTVASVVIVVAVLAYR